MSRKSERLVNLTIALLHTPRYLTKSEIFAKVAGYEGAAEAKERMFERDKDELRSIGIDIDVQQIDPLFNDEAGYRIFPSRYSIQVDGLESEDIALMALGVKLVKTDNRDLLLRLQAMGADFQGETPIAPVEYPEISPLISAIDERLPVSFSYLDSEGVAVDRLVELYALYTRSNRWFLVANDCEKSALRTFRLDRISGDFSIQKGKHFERDSQFSLASYIHDRSTTQARIRVRKGAAWELRGLASKIEDGDEWDFLTIDYFSQEWIVDKVLWHCDNAFVEAPHSLRDSVILALKQVIALHE